MQESLRISHDCINPFAVYTSIIYNQIPWQKYNSFLQSVFHNVEYFEQKKMGVDKNCLAKACDLQVIFLVKINYNKYFEIFRVDMWVSARSALGGQQYQILKNFRNFLIL